ncbi:TBP-ASSOCIATED FACTOR 6B [Artemisia annua]|uniref:TBP-ASSOCIATED FACTOR 6B n=1 Tax=Artemisia annua TaxID=35608 RepID=A0A2U1LFR1_ARTAN|nr:TBP-ASSOCIATED FACTOR 6B [Artemisia annua]
MLHILSHPASLQIMEWTVVSPKKHVIKSLGLLNGLGESGMEGITGELSTVLQEQIHCLQRFAVWRRHEARRVHGALMCAAGLYIYNQLMTIPNLLAPPTHSIWKKNGKFGTSNPSSAFFGKKASAISLCLLGYNGSSIFAARRSGCSNSSNFQSVQEGIIPVEVAAPLHLLLLVSPWIS